MTQDPKTDFTLNPDFDPVSAQAWREVIERDLKGAPFEKKLVSHTRDGLRVEPLYHQQDWDHRDDPSGFPGQAPQTRGARATSTGWDNRQACAVADPAQANAALLRDLTRGAQSVSLQLPHVRGPQGMHLKGLDDLRVALEGVHLDWAPFALDAGALTLPMTALVLAWAKERGVSWDALQGDLGYCPWAAWSAGQALHAPLAQSTARGLRLATWCHNHSPKLRALAVDTLPFEEAGASDAQALAVAMSMGVAWLRAAEDAGVVLETVCDQLTFRMGLGSRFFEGIARLRAARRLWSRVTQACGIKNAAMRTEVRPLQRTWTRRDPWVNLLRNTAVCFAGAVGGADVVCSASFTQHEGDVLGRRIARNTSIILGQEAHLGQIMDPAGGSWFLESLTNALAQKAWSIFQSIEAQGGLEASLRKGTLQAQIEETWSALAHNVARRKAPVIGVSVFANLEEVLPEAPASSTQTSAGTQTPPQALASEGGIVDAMIQAAAAGQSMQELAGALVVPGAQALAQALVPRSDAGAWEALRDRSDAHLAKHGQRPAVCLIGLGTLPQFKARAGFVRDLVQAGGFTAQEAIACQSPQEAAQAFADSGAAVVAICGQDARYGQEGASVAKALARAGANRVVLAGRPGALESDLSQAGVTDFVYLGCDVLEVVHNFWSVMEDKP